ncbi:MAG: nucleotidyltransferase family protein [Rhodospirillaceae bacterium]|nr:nucleotidyltransferase family protein [Rhodospirillaceae bacterium]
MAGFTALILAGSRSPKGDGLNNGQLKALLPVYGMPMIDRVIATVAASKHVNNIVVCGPPHLGNWPGVTFFPTGTSPANSILQFLESRIDTNPVLITTADHPLLTTEMVDYFCAQAAGSRTDLAVGMVDNALVRRTYAASRTAYKFRGGEWKSCNLFAAMTPAVANVVHFWQFVEKNRKKPWRVVRAFGLATLLGVLLRRWNLHEALMHAGTRLGITAAPVIMPWPEAAIDVDSLGDKALAESILSARPQLA